MEDLATLIEKGKALGAMDEHTRVWPTTVRPKARRVPLRLKVQSVARGSRSLELRTTPMPSWSAFATAVRFKSKHLLCCPLRGPPSQPSPARGEGKVEWVAAVCLPPPLRGRPRGSTGAAPEGGWRVLRQAQDEGAERARPESVSLLRQKVAKLHATRLCGTLSQINRTAVAKADHPRVSCVVAVTGACPDQSDRHPQCSDPMPCSSATPPKTTNTWMVGLPGRVKTPSRDVNAQHRNHNGFLRDSFLL